jgi:hypothetical protein
MPVPMLNPRADLCRDVFSKDWVRLERPWAERVALSARSTEPPQIAESLKQALRGQGRLAAGAAASMDPW